ncbi:glycosyltransferase family 2 protein [Pararcticibacter amylolyticus]|uniref:Glycosyltransferase 2-like domain-containing protein n=1 Tax=Pararcticibacter amylolyticus TaxID=2173175 RepID=A0A2U2PG19_9SPHI|nr:glycosyltransferase family A protein [Pararcticibacter amylolyticus]PWG80212.1 hypothetical protein DDR33_13545 [Pararcticibacter amylolyticus]
MSYPYVSCIMPTANRPLHVPFAVNYFLNQDFRDTELIIIDDGTESVAHLIPDHRRIKYFYRGPQRSSIGQKRNYACSMAIGELIVHWDDDDYYAQNWITKEIEAIETSGADICGLNDVLFFSPIRNKFWRVHNPSTTEPWIAGATMIYKRSFWIKYPFKDLQIGEDYDFAWNSGGSVFAHDYTDGFIAILHNKNTTLKPFESPGDKLHASPWMNVEFTGNKATSDLTK